MTTTISPTIQNDVIIPVVGLTLTASRVRQTDIDCDGRSFIIERGMKVRIVSVDSSDPNPTHWIVVGQMLCPTLSPSDDVVAARMTRLGSLRDDWTGSWVTDATFAQGVPGWKRRSDAADDRKRAKRGY